MAKLSFNKGFNINRVVTRLVYTILGLYVGGTIITTFATVMNCTTSPFYDGLSLIGWTVTDGLTINASGQACSTDTSGVLSAGNTYNNVITDVSGAGVLAVVGIIGIASVVLEFVKFKY